jgi:hypothetical protein
MACMCRATPAKPGKSPKFAKSCFHRRRRRLPLEGAGRDGWHGDKHSMGGWSDRIGKYMKTHRSWGGNGMGSSVHGGGGGGVGGVRFRAQMGDVAVDQSQRLCSGWSKPTALFWSKPAVCCSGVQARAVLSTVKGSVLGLAQ